MAQLPRTTQLDLSKVIVIIESCANCDTHSWNTRHDEDRYVKQALQLASAIRASHNDTIILFN